MLGVVGGMVSTWINPGNDTQGLTPLLLCRRIRQWYAPSASCTVIAGLLFALHVPAHAMVEAADEPESLLVGAPVNRWPLGRTSTSNPAAVGVRDMATRETARDLVH